MRIPQRFYDHLPRRLPKEGRLSNHAIVFDSTLNNRVDCGFAASLNVTVPFFVETWIYPFDSGEGGFGRIVDKRTSFSCYMNGAGVEDLKFRIWELAATKDAPSAGGAVSYNRWHHIVGGWDNVIGRVVVYVDTVRFLGPLMAAIDGAPATGFTIGNYDIASRGFNGFIDEVRLVPVAPTQALVNESYYRGIAKRELDARLVVRMEQGAGLTAHDESGYGNNGALLPVATPPAWVDVTKYELLSETGV